MPKTHCEWTGCDSPRFFGTPVCLYHACLVSRALDEFVEHGYTPSNGPLPPPRKASDGRTSYVYYLMLNPTTVKIGTTRNLAKRLEALHTSAQYVVALESGDRALEADRHKQFATDRREREQFALSDHLRQHITDLQPDRDQLLVSALAQ